MFTVSNCNIGNVLMCWLAKASDEDKAALCASLNCDAGGESGATIASMVFDATTGKLTITLTDETSFSVFITSVVTTKNSNTVTLTGTGVQGDALSAGIKLDPSSGNLLFASAHGLKASAKSESTSDIAMAGDGSLSSPFKASLIVDPAANNLLSSGEEGALATLTTADGQTVALSGTGTAAAPLTAAVVLDPATDNQLTASAAGLHVSPELPAGGTTGQVLTKTATGVAFADAAGGLQYWTEANGSSLTPNTAATNAPAIIAPKGNGAFVASLTGDARGENAVDLQMVRGTGAQVASGAKATIGGGTSNIASGQYSTVSGGNSNSASGQYSTVSGGGTNFAIAIGATVTGGIGNSAGTVYSRVGGVQGVAVAQGDDVFGMQVSVVNASSESSAAKAQVRSAIAAYSRKGSAVQTTAFKLINNAIGTIRADFIPRDTGTDTPAISDAVVGVEVVFSVSSAGTVTCSIINQGTAPSGVTVTASAAGLNNLALALSGDTKVQAYVIMAEIREVTQS